MVSFSREVGDSEGGFKFGLLGLMGLGFTIG